MATDAELIERSLADPEAFVGVFDRHFNLVHRFLRARAEDVADDLAAKTFTLAFRRRADYQPSGTDARPWLLAIAVNLLRGHLRAKRRRRAALARLDGEGAFDPAHALLERLDARRAIVSLRAVLDGLPPADRDLLVLFACVGLTYEEVAEALSIPVGTVRSRIHRLRRRLRAALQESTPEKMEAKR